LIVGATPAERNQLLSLPAAIAPDMALADADTPEHIALRLRLSDLDLTSAGAAGSFTNVADRSDVILWLIERETNLALEMEAIGAVAMSLSRYDACAKPHLIFVMQHGPEGAETGSSPFAAPLEPSSVVEALGSAYGGSWDWIIVAGDAAKSDFLNPVVSALRRSAGPVWKHHQRRTSAQKLGQSYVRSAWNAVAQVGSLATSLLRRRS
jgi:hypothetical protein